uniref:hypothetical protein n=1 Tax=Mycoplasmopsis bovis TaxID=28903 RepID=UPI003D295806
CPIVRMVLYLLKLRKHRSGELTKTEKTNIGIIDENKKKELLKELDKQFSISPDYNVIEKAVQKYFKEIKKIDFWFNVLTKK